MAEIAGGDAAADVVAGALPGERDEQPAAAVTKTHAAATPIFTSPAYYRFVFCLL